MTEKGRRSLCPGDLTGRSILGHRAPQRRHLVLWGEAGIGPSSLSPGQSRRSEKVKNARAMAHTVMVYCDR
jgi:hypothetical protein